MIIIEDCVIDICKFEGCVIDSSHLKQLTIRKLCIKILPRKCGEYEPSVVIGLDNLKDITMIEYIQFGHMSFDTLPSPKKLIVSKIYGNLPYLPNLKSLILLSDLDEVDTDSIRGKLSNLECLNCTSLRVNSSSLPLSI